MQGTGSWDLKVRDCWTGGTGGASVCISSWLELCSITCGLLDLLEDPWKQGMTTGGLWIVLTHQLRNLVMADTGCKVLVSPGTKERAWWRKTVVIPNITDTESWSCEISNSGKNKHPAWFSWASFLFVLLEKGKIGIISTLQWLVFLSEHKLHHL